MGKTVSPSIEIYTTKMENRITFKIKTAYYLERLIPETMKLLGSTKSKITKDKIGKNVPYLKITEIVLIHCIIVNNSIIVLWMNLFVTNRLVNY